MLSHAFGAAFDNPDLIVAAVVGDGEAETGPLGRRLEEHQLPQSGARRRRAADPAPQRLQDQRPDRARPRQRRRHSRLLQGNGYEVHFVEGDDPARVHQPFAAALDRCYDRIRAIQQEARAATASHERPRWPAIVLRTPKGWTGPKVVDGLPVEGTFRAHQVPLANAANRPRRSSRSSTSGCAATARRSCSTPTASSWPSSPRSRRRATAA